MLTIISVCTIIVIGNGQVNLSIVIKKQVHGQTREGHSSRRGNTYLIMGE